MSQLLVVASLVLSAVALTAAVGALVTLRAQVVVVSLGIVSLTIAALLALMGAPWLALAQLVMGALALTGFARLGLISLASVPSLPVRNGLQMLGGAFRNRPLGEADASPFSGMNAKKSRADHG